MLPSRWVASRFRAPADTRFLADAAEVQGFHATLPGHAPTPLVALPALARALGLGALWIKDERHRFGLNAFKGLGASYAIHRFLAARGAGAGPLTFATATDGNHGRAVAWSARRLGHAAVVYVPRNTVPARLDAIRAEGARCEVIDGTYDETVRRVADDAARAGWHVISDTAWPGYLEIPAWIMSGYATLFREAAAALPAPPTAVFLQAGVGGLACAGVAAFPEGPTRPRLISVEPLDADCLAESAATPTGALAVARGGQDSIMAGLNCGTPSLLAWPAVRAGVDGYLAIDDGWAEDAMRTLARPGAGDAPVISGESGAAGLAGLLALCREPALAGARASLGLDAAARVLLLSTEGDTDPASYRRVLGAA